jgi:hypothetical protein
MFQAKLYLLILSQFVVFVRLVTKLAENYECNEHFRHKFWLAANFITPYLQGADPPTPL